jgi:thiamine biosynthesis lipoprotein
MLNKAGGRRQPVSSLLAEALAVALRAAAATDGDVDPTCGQSLVRLGYDRDFAALARRRQALAIASRPVRAGGWQRVDLDRQNLTVQIPADVQIDLGATAKALAADRAAHAIVAATGGGALVNLGGDIAAAGMPPPSGWRIQIAANVDGIAPRPVIAIRDGGLATSSPGSRTWRRGHRSMHHIINPRTGRSAVSCWSAATVAAATCVNANTASTAAIIRSTTAPDWLASLGLPARLVRIDGMVRTVGEWPHEL